MASNTQLPNFTDDDLGLNANIICRSGKYPLYHVDSSTPAPSYLTKLHLTPLKENMLLDIVLVLLIYQEQAPVVPPILIGQLCLIRVPDKCLYTSSTSGVRYSNLKSYVNPDPEDDIPPPLPPPPRQYSSDSVSFRNPFNFLLLGY